MDIEHKLNFKKLQKRFNKMKEEIKKEKNNNKKKGYNEIYFKDN